MIRVAFAVVAAIALIAPAARGQSIEGPDRVDSGRLARLSIAWPDPAEPGKAAWIVTPLDGVDFEPIGDRLILTGDPGTYTVIAGIVEDGEPAFLSRTLTIVGPRPPPGPIDPDPVPTPDPVPDGPPRVEDGTDLAAILLFDGPALTPEVAGIRSSGFASRMVGDYRARLVSLPLEGAEAVRSGYSADMPDVRRVGGPPAILYLALDPTAREWELVWASPATTNDLEQSIKAMRGE